MIQGQKDLLDQTLSYNFNTIVDIGAGDGSIAEFFRTNKKSVTVTGYEFSRYGRTSFHPDIKVLEGLDICNMKTIADQSFDAAWCSHVIEHVLNVEQAFNEIHRILKTNGLLFISVPAYSPHLVGGHVNTGWHLGTLMYVLILCGFNVKEGMFINHCWNITGFVKKSELPDISLAHDKGDIEILKDHFPESIPIHQGVNGEFKKINWNWSPNIAEEAEKNFKRAQRRMLFHNIMPPIIRNFIKEKKLSS